MADERILKIQKKILKLQRQLKELNSVSYTSLDRDFVQRQMQKVQNELTYWQKQI